VRIIAGLYGGRPLTTLGKGDSGAHLRPTSDRVREAIFSMVAARREIEGTRVLDLFAGTGALGLEALSRGAEHATFVDNGRKAQALIRANIAKLGVSSAAVLPTDASRIPSAPAPCDLVFLDPPYGKSLGAKALAEARAQEWIAADALVIWEERHQERAEGFSEIVSRVYGETTITLLEPVP